MRPFERTKTDDARSSPASDDTRDSRDFETGNVKRKRQSQSCDACRARKVRCAREITGELRSSCKHCVSLGIPCTYDYQPRKRGPPNLYLRRLQQAAAVAATQTKGEQSMNDTRTIIQENLDPQSASTVSGNFASSQNLPSTYTERSSGSHLATHSFTHSTSQVTSTTPIPPSRYPIAADLPDSHYPPSNSTRVDPSFSEPAAYNVSNRPSSTATTVSSGDSGSPAACDKIGPSSSELHHPLDPWSYSSKHVSTNPELHIQYLPPLSYFVRPHRLEDVAPRGTILLVISLFFDFVYPLTPCIHKPSFMADLRCRREERDSLFFALVMSTVASTCVQVPRSYLPMERREVRRLAQTCYEASRHITVAGYDPPTTSHVVIRYFDTLYHLCAGQPATSYACFGEAVHTGVILHMHDEMAYKGLDPIEAEIRRRMFWLLFDADKSISLLLERPMYFRDEDCNIQFPKEVDDEYITLDGISPQPSGKTAIISGLNYVSRLFALLGEILVRIRADKRTPPQGYMASVRLEEVNSLHERTMAALARVPPPLQLKTAHSFAMETSFSHDDPGFTKTAIAEVKDFFDNPNASRANASNAYLVMQANLYVTQQLVRFVIEQYRHDLVVSMRGSMGDHTDAESTIREDREAVASDLLNILHSIPIQSIATNGQPLVYKVRFVASTLLDAVRQVDTAPDSAARAHAYLWDFLSILSEIERNYMLDDD